MRQFILCISIFCSFSNIMFGQCYPDRHSTNWFDGWISCESSPLPNSPEENGHWIMYDFGEVYKFGEMTIWNTNDPAHLNWGLRDVSIGVSVDGVTWTNVGSYTFAQASGLSTYEGIEGPDLGDIEGRYLLMIAESNWGGECYGLSEIRIAAEETVISSVTALAENACFSISASPNPFASDTDVQIKSNCPQDFEYSVLDVLGRIVSSGVQAGDIGVITLKMNLNDLPQGTYYLRITQEENSAQLTLVKFNRR